MIEGKAELVRACKHRKMKVSETPINLLQTRIHAAGVLDGMEVQIDSDCIAGMPGESMGTLTVRGNLAQLLAVLARVWPAPPAVEEAFSPGRQSWPYVRHYGGRPTSARKR